MKNNEMNEYADVILYIYRIEQISDPEQCTLYTCVAKLSFN